ncbi:MAG: 16S rRNA (cytosine(967)-C(5))-methyltransferase RsmB [Clostridia bacterium]|nr:16S rRNA (cytosine(967)-C(5))-methyltransferase RsmB [Clostridia bacterium]
MNNAFLKSFQTLQQVYKDKAFSGITLNKTLTFCKNQDKALITKLVYGVLENDIKLTYLLGKFVKKMPKGDVLIILKMGVYCLMELSIPQYTVVNDLAEIAKVTEDRRQVGFVNATLKRIAQSLPTFNDYPTDELECLSVKFSYPMWALKKLVKDYGLETAKLIVCHKLPTNTTVRVVGLGKDQVEQKFGKVESTMFADAYKISGKIPPMDGSFTMQSLSSMAICQVVANGIGAKFLDCCSAPGGKAVYVKQLCPQTQVDACDVHPHRVQLINDYAKRMGVEVATHCQDMTMLVPEWQQQFDTVLCDVPCSGFGVLDNRPDIKLFRESLDVSSLMKLQQQILQTCSAYVKVGGRLIYSTCTVFNHENLANVEKFLKNNGNFAFSTISLPQFPMADGKPYYQFLPHKDGVQGFFVAVLTRTE